MLLKNTESQYGLISKLFHWGIFIVLVALLITASMSEDLPRGPEKLEIIKLHASLGFLMLNLMILRLLWRWFNTKPANMSSVPNWQNNAAFIVHILLYVLIIAQALSGILRAATVGFDIPFFGLFDVSLPIEKNEALNKQAKEVHGVVPILLMVTLALHILAALYHHFKLKDNTLRRMTIGIKED